MPGGVGDDQLALVVDDEVGMPEIGIGPVDDGRVLFVKPDDAYVADIVERVLARREPHRQKSESDDDEQDRRAYRRDSERFAHFCV